MSKEKLVPIYVTESQYWDIKRRMTDMKISKTYDYIEYLLCDNMEAQETENR